MKMSAQSKQTANTTLPARQRNVLFTKPLVTPPDPYRQTPGDGKREGRQFDGLARGRIKFEQPFEGFGMRAAPRWIRAEAHQ